MSAGSAAKLYTADVLGLATQLANYPLTDDLPLRADSRSRTCGSTLSIGLDADDCGAIRRLGLQVSACAVGQAAAAIFAQDAIGHTQGDLERARTSIETWLSEGHETPAWPGLDVLDPARMHPARHGAILLPWTAAIEALSKG